MMDSSVAAAFKRRAIGRRYCIMFFASSCCCCFFLYSWDRREASSFSLLKRFRSKSLNESHVVVHVLFADHHVAVSLHRRCEANRFFIRSWKDWGNVAPQSSMNVSGFSVRSPKNSGRTGTHISCCWARLSMLKRRPSFSCLERVPPDPSDKITVVRSSVGVHSKEGLWALSSVSVLSEVRRSRRRRDLVTLI
jgi:hypothetical protein